VQLVKSSNLPLGLLKVKETE